MSYLKKVELQRERNRQIERKRKSKLAHQGIAARKPRQAAPTPLAKGERSIWRKMFDAFTGHRSKGSLEAEARMREAKARVEADEKAKAEKAV